LSFLYGYRKPGDLPGEIPIFPLNGALLLPRAILPLNIFEPRYLNMVDDVVAGKRIIGMVQTAPPRDDRAEPPLQKIGCAGRLTSFHETDDGRYLVTLTGVSRFRVIDEEKGSAPYRIVKADYSGFGADLLPTELGDVFNRELLFDRLRRYLSEQNMTAEWDAVDDAPAETLVNSLCMACPFDPIEKQALLEARTVEERHNALISLLEMGGGTVQGGGLQ
jgi:uncharacterized protein